MEQIWSTAQHCTFTAHAEVMKTSNILEESSALTGTQAYRLLATSRAVPDSVSPALVKRGDCSRQRTWYQCVSGSVGAVDSHTVILQGGHETRLNERLKTPAQVWSSRSLTRIP